MGAVGCLLLLIALISPRLAIVIMAVTSDMLSRSMDGNLLPFLGFFLLPWTTLSYAWFWDSGREVAGFEIFVVVLAFLIDLGAYIGGGKRQFGD
jgi:hypothetical protein